MASPGKRVRWSTITIHEFGVGYGGSAVPKSGPSIGLAPKPEFTWSTRVGCMARECDGVRRFTSAERVALLRDAGFSSSSVDEFVAEAKRVRSSRELYYSREMKQFRKKRKLAKADARAARRKPPTDKAAPLKDTRSAIEIVAVDEHETKLQVPLRITVATAADLADQDGSSTVRICAPLLPPVLPMSPCCS